MVDRAGFIQRSHPCIRPPTVCMTCCPQDGVNRAGLNALGAANALRLANPGHDGLLFRAVLSVERLGLNIQQVSQRLNGLFTAGGALLMASPSAMASEYGDSRDSRTGHIGFGEQGIDLFADRVAFHAKTNRRKTQQRAEHRTQAE